MAGESGKISGAKLQGGIIVRSNFVAYPQDYSSWKMGLFFSENDASKVLLNGGNVETVYDKSYAATVDFAPRDFTQSVAGSRGAFTAGVGTTFNDDFMECTSNLITDSEGTLLMVLRFDRTNTEEYIFSKADSTAGDGNGFSFEKNASNLKRTILAVGVSGGIQGDVAVTDTTTFRVYVLQKNRIFQNAAQDTITVVGAGGNTYWFNTPTGGTQRMCIAKRAGTIANYGRFTCKAMHYFNTTLSPADVVKLVNGQKSYYNI